MQGRSTATEPRGRRPGRAREGVRHRRDRVHGRPPRADAGGRRRRTCGPSCGRAASRSAAARELRALGIEIVAGRPGRRGGRRARPAPGATSATTSRRRTAKPGSPTAPTARSTWTARATCSTAPRRAGVRRVVHCSTGGVHGHIEHPPANEDAPFGPGDIYQETKLEAEQLAREYGRAQRPRRERRAADRHLRPGRHPLPEDVPRHRPRPVPDARVAARCSTTSPSSATSCEGFRLAATCRRRPGRTYIIGGPAYTTLNELAATDRAGARREAALAPPARLAVLGGGRALRGGVHPAAHRAAALPAARGLLHEEPRVRHDARPTELGYVPQVSLDEGLRLTAEWYREQGLL